MADKLKNAIRSDPPGIGARVWRAALAKRKLLIAILIIALLAAHAYLGTGYIEAVRDQEVLTSEIAVARLALARIPDVPQDLEQQLAAAQASLTAVQDAFPAEMSGIEVIYDILRAAEDIGVTAIPLVVRPWSIETVGEHSYNVLQLTVSFAGRFSQLLSFIRALQEEFETLTVAHPSVTRVGEGPEEEDVPEEIIVTTSLSLTIYTRPPAPD